MATAGTHSLAWGWKTLVMSCRGPRDLGKVWRARWRLKNMRKEKGLVGIEGLHRAMAHIGTLGRFKKLSLQGCH